jgi:hypothetical protein
VAANWSAYVGVDIAIASDPLEVRDAILDLGKIGALKALTGDWTTDGASIPGVFERLLGPSR